MTNYPNPYGMSPAYNPVPPSKAGRRGLAQGARTAVGFAVVIWAVSLVNFLMFNGNLNYFGIQPRDPSSLWHIVTSPLLHGSYSHLASNTVPAMVFCFIIGSSGQRVWWEVTAIVGLIGGFGTWLTGGVGTNHIGASGLVYGWLTYLIVRGLFNRSFSQIVVGVVLGVFYSGLVWGVLPTTPGVSWQGHLFGSIGGIVAGMVMTSDDPPALRSKRAAQQRL